jgi:hypothetical protein
MERDFEEDGFEEDEVRLELGFKHIAQMAYFGDSSPRDMSRDPAVKFENFVFTVFNDLKHLLHFTQDDLHVLMKHVKAVPNPGYKNPTAFIIGYWLTQTKTHIDKVKFKRIIKELATLTYPILPQDAVRYGHLWINALWNTDN